MKVLILTLLGAASTCAAAPTTSSPAPGLTRSQAASLLALQPVPRKASAPVWLPTWAHPSPPDDDARRAGRRAYYLGQQHWIYFYGWSAVGFGSTGWFGTAQAGNYYTR